MEEMERAPHLKRWAINRMPANKVSGQDKVQTEGGHQSSPEQRDRQNGDQKIAVSFRTIPLSDYFSTAPSFLFPPIHSLPMKPLSPSYPLTILSGSQKTSRK